MNAAVRHRGRKLLGVGVVGGFVAAAVIWVLPLFGSPAGASRDAQVVRVIDGDTIVVSLDGADKRVRLIGIDAPEITNGKHDCFGLEAANALDVMVAGKSVELVSDPTQTDRDRFDRLLRYVHVQGDDAGAQLVRGGWVREYTYSKSDPAQQQETYRMAQGNARVNGAGGWGECGDWSS